METDIANLISQLGNRDIAQRYAAYCALAETGKSSIPALCQALTESVPASSFYIRFIKTRYIIHFLYRFREESVLHEEMVMKALFHALLSKDSLIHSRAAGILHALFPAKAMSKQLLTTPFTPQQCLIALIAIRHPEHESYPSTVNYAINEIRDYCQRCLRDPDEALRKGAQQILDHLHLLRSGEALAAPPQEFLRMAASADGEEWSRELVRSSSSDAQTERPTGWWRNFWRNRKMGG